MAELVDTPEAFENLPHDISCFIVDLKLRDATIKILELGEINRSYLEGHDRLYGPGTIWKTMWDKMSEFGLPVWYVGTEVASKERKRKFALDYFESLGGTSFSSIRNLERNRLFKKRVENLAGQDLGGLVVMRYNHMGGSTKEFKSVQIPIPVVFVTQ